MKENAKQFRTCYIEALEKVELVDHLPINKEFKNTVFLRYFKELYSDLATRSKMGRHDFKNQFFIEFIQAPGILGERLFNIFDDNNSGNISMDEFLEGVTQIFSDKIETKMKFVFNMYVIIQV